MVTVTAAFEDVMQAARIRSTSDSRQSISCSRKHLAVAESKFMVTVTAAIEDVMQALSGHKLEVYKFISAAVNLIDLFVGTFRLSSHARLEAFVSKLSFVRDRRCSKK
jgi:hypothetical protein